MPIATTIARHSASLLEIPGVVGVAQGRRDGQDVVQILVATRTDSLVARLPAELDGHPVVIVESGEIRARDSAGDAVRAAPPSRPH